MTLEEEWAQKTGERGGQLTSWPRGSLWPPTPAFRCLEGRDLAKTRREPVSTLPACQEPRATGLEVLAVAATGQGLPRSTMTILSLPSPALTGTPTRHRPAGGAVPDPRARLSRPGQTHGAAQTAQPGTCGWNRTRGRSCGAGTSLHTSSGPRAPCKWHRLGEAGMSGLHPSPDGLAQPGRAAPAARAGSAWAQHQAANTVHHR